MVSRRAFNASFPLSDAIFASVFSSSALISFSVSELISLSGVSFSGANEFSPPVSAESFSFLSPDSFMTAVVSAATAPPSRALRINATSSRIFTRSAFAPSVN